MLSYLIHSSQYHHKPKKKHHQWNPNQKNWISFGIDTKRLARKLPKRNATVRVRTHTTPLVSNTSARNNWKRTSGGTANRSASLRTSPRSKVRLIVTVTVTAIVIVAMIVIIPAVLLRKFLRIYGAGKQRPCVKIPWWIRRYNHYFNNINMQPSLDKTTEPKSMI